MLSHRSSASSNKSNSKPWPVPVQEEAFVPWFTQERRSRPRDIFGTTRMSLAREQQRGRLLQKKYAMREPAESVMDDFYWSHTRIPREVNPLHPGLEAAGGPIWFAGQPPKLDIDAVRRKYRGLINKP